MRDVEEAGHSDGGDEVIIISPSPVRKLGPALIDVSGRII